jgi:hypothetical protein
MYVENKQGVVDGVSARIGWVEFSQSGSSVYFHGRTLNRIKGGGVSGNFRDAESGEEYWISGVKRRGSNAHWAASTKVTIDSDAREAYQAVKDDMDE